MCVCESVQRAYEDESRRQACVWYSVRGAQQPSALGYGQRQASAVNGYPDRYRDRSGVYTTRRPKTESSGPDGLFF